MEDTLCGILILISSNTMGENNIPNRWIALNKQTLQWIEYNNFCCLVYTDSNSERI